MHISLMAIIFLLAALGVILLIIGRSWCSTVSMICLILIALLSLLDLIGVIKG